MYGLILLVACADGTAPEADFTGAYDLQTVNGHALPVVVAQSGPNTVSVISDHLVVADGGSWSEVAVYRLVENGASHDETQNDGGTWVRAGSQLSLYSAGSSATSYVGAITRNTLTFNDGTFVQVFTK